MEGEINPLDVATVFIIAYKVPAKLGAKSCKFCRFVSVAAPFDPNDVLMQ